MVPPLTGTKPRRRATGGRNTTQQRITNSDPRQLPARDISPADAEDADEDATEADQRTIRVAVRPVPAARIANPALRALWQQAHGDTLPLPGELESREAMLATIRDHLARQEPSPPA